MKNNFNPYQWLPNSTDALPCVSSLKEQSFKESQSIPSNTEIAQEIETIIQRIEEKQLDIATAYSDWRDIGFALADALNDDGRSFFHRISKYYTDYNPSECDTQFDKCLKAKGTGITIRSFFEMAKRAGVNINTKPACIHNHSNDDFEETPSFPDSIFNSLPPILYEACSVFKTSREKDIILLGSIVTLSSCIPNTYGIYGNSKVYSNLYLFVTAQASAGKGSLAHCKRLVYPIHKQLREMSVALKQEYQTELNHYVQNVKKNPDLQKPTEPRDRMLYLPANNSATGVFQLLYDCEGKGLIFETEGDTLAFIFKTDYGNYSDGFRKAFHHENISFYRRTNHEYVDINSPRLSAVLTGTPAQIVNLIPSAEDGLFSRFMYYRFNLQNVWNDVFAKQTANGFDDYFNELGNRFYTLYQSLLASYEREFCFTADQQDLFNESFKQWQSEFLGLLGAESVANVRRLGIICFRMAMVMSVLRTIETGEMPSPIICSDTDFLTCLEMCRVLLDHSKTVYLQLLTTPRKQKQDTMQDKFYQLLPTEFTRKEAVEIAAKINIKPRTADKYLTQLTPTFLTKDNAYGKYRKQTVQSVQSTQKPTG